MRIAILGLHASGKSTLARAISEKFSIPHINIDSFWFESGGGRKGPDTPNTEEVRATVRSRVQEAITQESWVSDGSHIQPEMAERADAIVFLDIPLWQRLLNHLQRIPNHKQRHKKLTLWDDIKFFNRIVSQTNTTGPRIREFLKDYIDKTVVLRSRKEIGQYLASLK